MRRADEPPEIPDAERERITRGIVRRLQWGGAVFLAVVLLGLVPPYVAQRWPALEGAATTAVWILAPLLGIGLLVLAVLRVRR